MDIWPTLEVAVEVGVKCVVEYWSSMYRCLVEDIRHSGGHYAINNKDETVATVLRHDHARQ